MPAKNKFFLKILLYFLLIVGTSGLQGVIKLWKSRFSSVFCLLMEGSGSVSVSIQIITDPDPRGPKTYVFHWFWQFYTIWWQNYLWTLYILHREIFAADPFCDIFHLVRIRCRNDFKVGSRTGKKNIISDPQHCQRPPGYTYFTFASCVVKNYWYIVIFENRYC
jgi:hypothetical protein